MFKKITAKIYQLDFLKLVILKRSKTGAMSKLLSTDKMYQLGIPKLNVLKRSVKGAMSSSFRRAQST